MNPLDFLTTANKLLAAGAPTQADIRTAIGRAYYALFHHVLLWWKGQTQLPDYKDRAHAKIRIAIFNAGISGARNFSRRMDRLNIARRKADYELGLHFNLADGQSALDLARQAVATFDALDKTALANGVEDYLRKTNQI
jgi:uncharacterized protein (UPF0332 family)